MNKRFKHKYLLTLSWILMGGVFLLTITSCEEEEPVPPAATPVPSDGSNVLPCNYFNTNKVLVNDSLKDVDYIIDCFILVENGEFIIEEGVTIEFTENAGIHIGDGAQLIAKGTAEAPITLTGTKKNQGHWRGILINSNLENSVSHTKIEYAGSQFLTETPPIYQGSLAAGSDARLNLSYVEILNGGSYGLDFTGQNAVISVDHVTISGNNDYPVKASAYNAHVFDNTSTFTGNGGDYLNIGTANYEIKETVEWKKLDVPYLVDGGVHIKNNGFLTIAPGVQIYFRQLAYIEAHDNAAPYNYGLNIVGTPNEPVRLSGRNGSNWGGISYWFTQENNLIKHAIIENAKGDIPGTNITNTGAIYMRADPKLTIEDTEFRNLPNCAYYAYTGTSTNQPDLPNFSATNLSFTEVNGEEFCWGDGNE